MHGHAKGEHKPFAEERPIAYSPRMLFLWFYHACRRGSPRFMMVSDHINYLTFEDPGAVHTVRRALKLAEAGDLYGAAETAGVDVTHAAVVSQGLRRGMRFAIGAEVDNDPRARPDAQNIVDAMRPDGMIRAVHFITIEHPEKGADFQWQFDNPEFRDLFEVVGTERVWELYVAKLIDDIEKLPGNIVAHFHSPATFGHWPDDSALEKYEERMLDACAARGMAIEVSTRYLYRDNPDEQKAKYRAALKRLIGKAKQKNVGIAVASDAHSPKDQGNGFAEMLKLLDEAGVNELMFPVGGRLARVALRATQEHLQKVKAQEPQPQPGSSITGMSRAELGLPERTEAEEREAASFSKTGHDAGPRKRASGSTRTTKKPVKEAGHTEEKPAKAARASSKAASKAAAKEAAPVKPPAKTKAVEKPAAAKAAAQKPVAKAAAKPVAKASAKPAPKEKAVKAVPKPPAKVKAKAPAAAAKSVKTAKAAVKAKPKAAAVKTAVKTKIKKTVPKAKSAAKKLAVKAAPKKSAAKKPAAKKAPVKTAKRTVAKKTAKRR